MEKKKYELHGRVVDRADGKGIPGILVEGWDKDQKYDDLLGSAITDKEGKFIMRFDSAAFADAYRDIDPDVFFKLFYEGAQTASTEQSVIHNLKDRKSEVEIRIISPRRNTGPNYFDRMSRELKAEMAMLVKHEARIVEKLKDREMANLFAENPVAALSKMDVPVPAQLKKRLSQGLAGMLKPRSFRLPNGQIITPQVNIHFTERKEAANVR